ncbi:hypothetical protein EDF62_1485 [Leucobacter luti]|uniref:Uncharacterized protein n=1 Tax=Leucobacter luti TaxID=340320 RepID=A0A4R6S2M2_9MICO|nr:hypothetical protein EDF62_1485 [Leucobacter luti]
MHLTGASQNTVYRPGWALAPRVSEPSPYPPPKGLSGVLGARVGQSAEDGDCPTARNAAGVAPYCVKCDRRTSASSIRVAVCVFRLALAMWFSTVRLLIPKRSAISVFVSLPANIPT